MAVNALKTVVRLELALLKQVALEPLITGPLLFALMRASPNVQQRLLRPLRNNLLSKNAAVQLARIIRTLKYLFAIGLARRLNSLLNRFALNFWYLRSPGTAWNFNDGKTEVVVITGGCSGFGYEMVKEFAGKAKVVALDISPMPEELSKLPEVHYFQCDIADFQAISAVAGWIRENHGNPTVLINNAGIAGGLGNSLTTNKPEFLERIFKVNLISHFVLIREFLPAMLEGRKGHIVTLASTASFHGYGTMADYCCTKAGALALHESLRGELRGSLPNGHCIQTTVVHPGWHMTGIVKPYAEAVMKQGVAIDPATNVSNRVVKQVMRGRSGQLIVPDRHWPHVFRRSWPTWYEDLRSGYAFPRRN